MMNSNSVLKKMPISDRILIVLLALLPIVAFGWKSGSSTAFHSPALVLIDTTNLEASICANQVYPFNGVALTESGVYTATLPASNGEDSVVVLQLTVQPLDTIFFTSALCDGDSLLFGDSVLTEPGVYSYVLPAGGATECDTIVSLALEVYPVSTEVQEVSICPGSIFLFNGDSLSVPGTYTATYSGENGCDSVVVLHLNLNSVDTTILGAQICAGASFTYDTLALSAAGVYTFIYPNTLGCDSVVVLTLGVLPVFEDSQEVVLCPGEIYTYGSDTLSNSGTYTYVEMASNGCDSLVVLQLTVLSTDTTFLEAVLCAGEQYVLNGDTLTASGTYSSTLTGSAGCDSTLILTLTVLPTLSGELSAAICEGETYLFGNDSLSVGGIYTTILIGSNGCDSTVTLQLTVLSASGTSVSAAICEGDTFEFEGQFFQSAGTYSFTYPNSVGCDSIVQLVLEVLPVPVSTDVISLCAGESYIYEGDTLSTAGNFTYTFTGGNGCDSLHLLEISVLPEIITSLSVSICEGGTYLFEGAVLDSSGLYTVVLESVAGCDSTVVLQLTTVNQFETAVSAQICAGETYLFNGVLLQDPGIYLDTLVAQGGCDSLLTLELKVLPVLVSNITATTCSDVPFIFNGQEIDQSGSYTAVLQGTNGCDSIVVLELIVLPINSLSVSGVICQGETYELNGNLFTTAGNYTLVSVGANGCTEIVELTLEVLPDLEEEISVSICAGTSYLFGNQQLSQEGTYELMLTSTTGCDSLVRLNLVVLPVASSSLQVSTCAGTPVEYNNQLLTAEGVYTFIFTSANGCDSTVTLILTYFQQNPPQTIELPICAGSSVIIGGQEITSPGVYEFSFEDVNGCDSLIEYLVTVIEVDATIAQQGNTLFAIEQPGQSYQWRDCNGVVIPGATSASFTPAVSGSYAVQITTSLGCIAVSQCIDVVVVSTKEGEAAEVVFSVYPNPTIGSVVISCAGCAGENWILQLRDLSGRLLVERFLPESWSGEVLNLEGFESGYYLIQLLNGEKVVNKPLIFMGN